jgi:tetratricopeptide (TPR) repeat protein
MRFKDPTTAISAAQSYLLYDSTNRQFKDTLAILYSALGMLKSSSMIADEILIKEPNNTKMLDISQSYLISTGKVEEANAINEKLYGLTKKSKYLFHIAYINIETGKFQEGLKVLERLKPSIDAGSTDSIEFQMGQQGGMQNVPVKAADLYLRAFVDIQTQRYQEAFNKYQACLKIYPDFYKAKENLQMLVQGMQRANPAK